MMDLILVALALGWIIAIGRLIWGDEVKVKPPRHPYRPPLKGLPWMGKEAYDAWKARKEYDWYVEHGRYNEWAKKHKKPRNPWFDI